ncbi:MAG: hypothetical protein RL199_926 [Pseudomonadota bacterium]|jgi:methyl-accepting chemotaxis protein
MSIRLKLLLLNGLFAAALAILSVQGYFTLHHVEVGGPVYQRIVAAKDLVADILPPPEYIIESHLLTLQMAAETDKAKIQAIAERAKVLRKDYDTRRQYWSDYWARNSTSPELKRLLLEDSYAPVESYFRLREEKLLPALLSGDRAGVQKTVAALDALYETHRAGIDKVVGKANEENAAAEQDAAATVHSRVQSVAILALLLGLAGALVGTWIARGISRPLGGMLRVLAAVAKGDLSGRVTVTSRDEIGQMGESLNGALTALATALSHIRDSAQELARYGQESNAVAQELSSVAEQTSAQANVVSSATQEMSSSIREISRSTSEAARIAASGASEAALTNDNVQRLGESSRAIDNVVQIIHTIAEQTKLLALNANIEAARAGEAGKGFGVVANEVKELARETARATKEISDRVRQIRADSDAAVHAIEGITRTMQQVSDLQSTIAAAVEEQTATTGEIVHNITGVAGAARTSAASATETRATARRLDDLAGELQRQVDRFVLPSQEALETDASAVTRMRAA